ncbi:MAG TPA: hypothetical protein VGM50_14295 [Gemmatimonadaceae bacterium]|jgi:hypothetical protein
MTNINMALQSSTSRTRQFTAPAPQAATNGNIATTAQPDPADQLRQLFVSHDGIRVLRRYIESQRDDFVATFAMNVINQVPSKPTSANVVALASAITTDAAAFKTQHDAYQTTIQSLHVALEWIDEQIAVQSRACGSDAVCVIDEMIANTRVESFTLEARREECEGRTVELERLRTECTQSYTNGNQAYSNSAQQPSSSTKNQMYTVTESTTEIADLVTTGRGSPGLSQEMTKGRKK